MPDADADDDVDVDDAIGIGRVDAAVETLGDDVGGGGVGPDERVVTTGDEVVRDSIDEEAAGGNLELPSVALQKHK